jgi:hypothetical protein
MALPDAVSSARRVLCRLADERQIWFKQTLPLSEVLVLSFATKHSGNWRSSDQMTGSGIPHTTCHTVRALASRFAQW